MKKRTIFGIGLSLVLLVAIVSAALIWYLMQPASQEKATSRFVITRGQAVGSIAQKLEKEGYIRSAKLFQIVVKVQGIERQLQAGSFMLSKSESPWEIARKLTSGTDDVWVTLPEGLRREEIAAAFEAQDLTEFNKATFLELSVGNEGYLYPDTYLVSREITAESAFSLLTRTFDQKVTQGLAQEIKSSKYSLEDAIVLASLLEREANGVDDMRHIAGVLWKRLEIGMPLQVDATLQYAKGFDQVQQSWWVPPTSADKSIESPFNTYLHPGLPPRPIANPGVSAVSAALNPLITDDLYYIHDRTGQVHFAKTLEGHNQNIAKYLQ